MNIENIKEMINSSDSECRYLAISILRYNEDISLYSKKESDKLIKSVKLEDRVRNFSDICKELNITEESCIMFYNPKNKEELSFNALNKIFRIVQYYNQEAPKNFPDFKDLRQYKYFPYFNGRSGSWLA